MAKTEALPKKEPASKPSQKSEAPSKKQPSAAKAKRKLEEEAMIIDDDDDDADFEVRTFNKKTMQCLRIASQAMTSAAICKVQQVASTALLACTPRCSGAAVQPFQHMQL